MKLEKKVKDIVIEYLGLCKDKDLEYIGIRKFSPNMFFILLKNGEKYISCIPLKNNRIRFYTIKNFKEIGDDSCTGFFDAGPITFEYKPDKNRTLTIIKYTWSEIVLNGKGFDINNELVIMKMQGFDFNWY